MHKEVKEFPKLKAVPSEAAKVQDLYAEGATYQEIADLYGITRERVRQVLTLRITREQLSTLKQLHKAARLEEQFKPLRAAEAEILSAYLEGKSLAALRQEYGVSMARMREFIKKITTPAQRSERRGTNKPQHTFYSDSELLHYLRWAIEVFGASTTNKYEKVRKEYNLPSTQTIMNRFGGWLAALEKLGLEATEHQLAQSVRVARRLAWTEEAILDAMYYLHEHLGEIPPAHVYDTISPTTPWIPSNHLVRVRLAASGLGKWRPLRRHITETYAEWSPRYTKEELTLIGEKTSAYRRKARKEVI